MRTTTTDTFSLINENLNLSREEVDDGEEEEAIPTINNVVNFYSSRDEERTNDGDIRRGKRLFKKATTSMKNIPYFTCRLTNQRFAAGLKKRYNFAFSFFP